MSRGKSAIRGNGLKLRRPRRCRGRLPGKWRIGPVAGLRPDERNMCLACTDGICFGLASSAQRASVLKPRASARGKRSPKTSEPPQGATESFDDDVRQEAGRRRGRGREEMRTPSGPRQKRMRNEEYGSGFPGRTGKRSAAGGETLHLPPLLIPHPVSVRSCTSIEDDPAIGVGRRVEPQQVQR